MEPNTNTTEPADANMITFCREWLPGVLRDQGVEADESAAVGADILERAEAFAVLDQATRKVLCVPFVEEAFAHEPAEASRELKAAVTVVVRNSRLEDAHVRSDIGPKEIKSITTKAAEPLAALLAARSPSPPATQRPDNPFLGLDDKYPRAWACLAALVETFPAGGRRGYRPPEAPVPALPNQNELVKAKTAEDNDKAVVLSAINERFDQQLMSSLRQASAGGFVFFVPSLSRVSRSSDKLLRVMEYILAHDSIILTTNYLLRPQDAWTRSKRLVRPDSYNPLASLRNTDGLTGAHRKLAREVAAQLDR